MSTGLDALTCRLCGARVGPHPASRRLIHRNDGVVAACDRDADHPPVPDWTTVGSLSCGVCRSALRVEGDVLHHEDTSQDGDHTPDPWARPAR